jgi:hypothetical protein
LLDEHCDYLVQITGNQPDVQDALQRCLGDAHERSLAAMSVEKKGRPLIVARYGLI